MKIQPRTWLHQIWPGRQKQFALLGEYAAIGAQHQLFLADVALRGRVFTADIAGATDSQTFVNLGRRELALEIIELCNVPPDRLFALIEKAPTKGET